LQDKTELQEVEADQLKGSGVPPPDKRPTTPDVAADAPVADVPLREVLGKDIELLPSIKRAYMSDNTFKKVLEHPKAHLRFGVKDSLIWTKNDVHRDVLCVLYSAMSKDQRVIKVIINHAHRVMGHFGHLKTTCKGNTSGL
jgi:hypothetical protein